MTKYFHLDIGYTRESGSRGGGVPVISRSYVNVMVPDEIAEHESLFLNMSFWGATFLLSPVYRAPEGADSFLSRSYVRLLAQHQINMLITSAFKLTVIYWL